MKLDNMSHDELMDFWAKHHRPGCINAKSMLPGMHKGHVLALAHYAANLATYKFCGEECYKTIAEKIYSELSVEAKELIR